MTTDSTLPQTELGPVPANGQGQSQGHRRRRRRRKGKAPQAGPPAAPAQAQSSPQPPVAAAPAQHRQPRQPHQNQNQNQGGDRRKKKFFEKGSRQPGNNGNGMSNSQGGGQGKRKGKQRGPREFVGPMDHSYRVANGNIADGPQSTIPTSGNGHAAHYQDNFAPISAAPRQSTATRIYCFIEDLFFQAKINETARKLGIKVEFLKGDKESVARITDAGEGERPALVVFDLNNLNAKPLTLIPKIRTKLKKATSIVGFLNHLQGDLKLKAVEAGCDTVMPRSAFSQTLPNLLRRYGLDEDEDNSRQPM